MDKGTRRERRGKWAGLTAKKFGRFIGVKECTSKKILYKLRDDLDRMPTEEDLGKFIFEYFLNKKLNTLDTYF